MIKNVIAPIQAWLLANGKCVGCSMPLSKASRKDKNGTELVTCKCGRIYVFDKESKKYRRALTQEI